MDTSPHTAVTWMVDGTAVDTSPDRISTGGATLSFSPVATSDSGRYTCQLTVTTSQTHVTVQGPMESTEREITVEGNYVQVNKKFRKFERKYRDCIKRKGDKIGAQTCYDIST